MDFLKFKGRLGTLLLGATGLILMSVAATATPLAGSLDIANCAGDGVIVTATTIAWLPGTSSSSGCIQTGSGTDVTYAGGILGAGTQGSILGLSGSLPVSNFMSFSGASGLSFTLTGLGPGDANTNCAGLTVGQTCSVASMSPFILVDLGSGTGVLLSASGTVTDGTSTNTWSGSFSESISGLTPQQIASAILGGGSISGTTYQGDFTLAIGSTTPEPATWALSMLGLGLVGIGMARRKSAIKAS